MLNVRFKYISVLVVFATLIGLVSVGSVSAADCWEYDDDGESACDALSDCQWFEDDWGGWCGEKGCWNFWQETQCTNSTDDLECIWESSSSSGWCEETSCWSFDGTDANACENNSENLNCEWQGECHGWNAETDCWDLTQNQCNNVTGCEWGACMDQGCWNYDDPTECQRNNGTRGGACLWRNDSQGGYCYEESCWEYDNTNRSYCEDNNPAGLDCQWDSAYDYCDEIECWSFDYTNSTECETNAADNYNLSCTWDGQYCMSSGCWDYYSESGCNDASGCSWEADMGGGGWCEEAACWAFDEWNGGNESVCNGSVSPGAGDYNLTCEWDNGACYNNIDENCSTFTTESDCMDTYYCWWECSDWSDQSTCNCSEPKWGDSGSSAEGDFFDEWNPGCYIFDISFDLCNASYAGTNASYCEDDTSMGVPYDCQWNVSGNEDCLAVPACSDVIGCNFSATYGQGMCDAVGNEDNSVVNVTQQDIEDNGINCSMINDTQMCNNIPALSTCCEWKSGGCQEKLGKECWENMDKEMEEEFEGIEACADASIFSNPQKKCNEISGSPLFMPCKWNDSTSKCEFKSSQVFGDSTESLALIQNKKNCQAAGGKWVKEWYCEGNRSVPAGRCEQKADEERNCDVACYACDYQFNGNAWNSTLAAESACYDSNLGYCEFTSDLTAPNGFGKCRAKAEFKSNVASDCTSDCGSCTYMGNPSADSNYDGTKKYSNCNTPKCYCEQAKEFDSVTCKWITDNSSDEGGYCVDSTTKTCQDACDRCYTKTDCSNEGRKAHNATGSCEWVTESGEASTSDTEGICKKKGSDEICWDGVDNDGDDLVDCDDNNCYSDSFCGFVEGDCPSVTTESVCNDTQLDNGMNCTWVTDNWGGYCDFPGADCYSKDGTNDSYCEANGICEWSSGDGDGWCEQDWGSAEECWDAMTEDDCDSATNCTWTNDTWCDENPDDQWCQDTGGWCDPDAFAPKNCWEKDETDQSECEGYNDACAWFNSSGEELCEEQGCWNYDFDRTVCNNQTNCNWQEDDWQSCEVDWSVNCWKYNDNETQCNTSDSCAFFGSGNSTWCGNKYDGCWEYGTSSDCNNNDNCYWTDWDSCEAACYNDSLTQSSCNDIDGCAWSSGWCEDSSMGGSTGGVDCWQYNDSGNCDSDGSCNWKNSGWCDPKGFSGGAVAASAGSSGGEGGSECWMYDGDETMCKDSSTINMTCSWIPEPWPFCEPDQSSDCMQYDGNQSACDGAGCWYDDSMGDGWCMNANEQCFMNDSIEGNSTLCNANSNCNWTDTDLGCEVDWNSVDTTCMMNQTLGGNETLCNSESLCNWSSEMNMCMGKFEVCFQAMNSSECEQHSDICFWNEMGGFCDPICFNESSETCSGVTGCNYVEGHCEPSAFMISTEAECNSNGNNWINGWCNPPGMGKMFEGMDMGAPVLIAQDNCNSNSEDSYADLCGVGLKDTGKSFSFGSPTADFSDAGVCNGENVMTMDSVGFGMGSANQGQGTSTVKYYIYLDTDGSRTGGCSPSNNKSMKGYEFFLKYTSVYDETLEKAAQSFTAKKCSSSGSSWKIADISLSTWKQKMCSMVGGPMIAVEKSGLEKFPTLYSSGEDVKIYATVSDSSHNATSPSDTAGPGWFTPGTVDFELQDFSGFGSDSAKNEDIMMKGYVEYEDCYTAGDEDGDGDEDCSDWDCQYADGCENSGVNADDYVDSSVPKVTGVKVEEYTDSALIMYMTNKPTNGSLMFYGNDSNCGTVNATIYDKGAFLSTVRERKLWHDGRIYNDGGASSLDWSLENSTNYYYKLEVCDSADKCSVSRCSSFKTAGSKCAYCNFVTLINSPTNWTVWYDLNGDGTYEHEQGNECGLKAGMRTNYSSGRVANVKLSEDGTDVQMEFLNVTLTKTGLTSKTRKISTSGDLIHDETDDYVGMPSGTRDKIINNLHPEVCRITVPTTGGDCNTLYHCNDNGEDCRDRTSESNLSNSTTTSCTWEIPYCEFSTWDSDGNSDVIEDDDGDDDGNDGGTSGGTTGGAPLELDEEEEEEEDDSESSFDSSDDDVFSPGKEDSTEKEETSQEDGFDFGFSTKTIGIIVALILVVLIALFYMNQRNGSFPRKPRIPKGRTYTSKRQPFRKYGFRIKRK